jgi:hypothetical protein
MTKPLEWQELWDAMDASPENWILTTENMYWQMLECLPPRAMDNGGFLVGEPLRHNSEGKAVHACFRRVGDQFHARNLTLEQFKGLQ